MEGSDRGHSVSSVSKALEILDIVGLGTGETGLSDIAEAAGLPRPTAHRLVRTLVNSGYLRQQPNRRYTLAPRLIPLGHAASAVFGTWSTQVLTDLVDDLGETANLVVLDGDQITYVGQAPSPHAMRMYTELGRRVCAHSRGVGKALLAQLPDQTVRALLERAGMAAVTPLTITDPATMLQELAQVRADGYATDRGEQEVGVNCVAVPVRVPANTTLMALSIAGPETRMTRELMDRAVPLLLEAADVLSSQFTDRASA